MGDAEFQRLSGGIRGVIKWNRSRRLLVNILQICADNELIEAEDMKEVRSLARYQGIYTAAALAEALLCQVLPDRPRPKARAALQFHLDLSLRTLLLCRVDGAPPCLLGEGYI